MCLSLCLCFFLQTHLLLTFSFFFFNDTATTEIYTLSLHDALPIYKADAAEAAAAVVHDPIMNVALKLPVIGDRKSTRLNSSHLVISYAVFCLKKKKNKYDAVLLIILTVFHYFAFSNLVTMRVYINH